MRSHGLDKLSNAQIFQLQISLFLAVKRPNRPLRNFKCTSKISVSKTIVGDSDFIHLQPVREGRPGSLKLWMDYGLWMDASKSALSLPASHPLHTACYIICYTTALYKCPALSACLTILAGSLQRNLYLCLVCIHICILTGYMHSTG